MKRRSSGSIEGLVSEIGRSNSIDDLSSVPLPEFGSVHSPEYIDNNGSTLDSPINSGIKQALSDLYLNKTVWIS